MHIMKHYYDILGLSPGASPVEVKQAYRDMIKVWHPDRYYQDQRLQEKVQDKLKEIIEAFDNIKKHHIAQAGGNQEEQRDDYYSEPISPAGCRNHQTKSEESKIAKRRSSLFNNFRTIIILLIFLFVMSVGDFSKITTPKLSANILLSSIIPKECMPIQTLATFNKPLNKEKHLIIIDTVKTKRGDLIITKGLSPEYRIKLNNDIIFQENNKRDIHFHLHFKNINNNEAVLLQESSEALTWFRLIMLKSDGTTKITNSFGNGSDFPEINHQGARITFSFPNGTGSLFRSGFWVFENGQLLNKRKKEISFISKLSKPKVTDGKPKSSPTVIKRSGNKKQRRVTE